MLIELPKVLEKSKFYMFLQQVVKNENNTKIYSNETLAEYLSGGFFCV